MKGIILNITEQFLKDKFGEDVLHEVREKSTLSTQVHFSGPGTYPDSDWVALLSTTSDILNIPLKQLQVLLGQYAFMQLAERFPQFVVLYQHPKEFLLTVEHMIHIEVRKMYADSTPPRFIYVDSAPNELIITYYSERKLYSFMEGILKGVEAYYKIPFTQEQKIYTENGVEQCDYKLVFSA